MKTNAQNNPYPVEPQVDKGELPDLFAIPGGQRISTRDAWIKRAQEWRDTVVNLEYGGLPPVPEAIRIETLCHSRIGRFPGEPNSWTFRIHCEGGEKPFSFCARIIFPRSNEPVPVIVNGDGCWNYVTDGLVLRVLGKGYALAVFNRTEMAEDLGYENVPDKTRRTGGLYDIYPGRTFGALSAWAWGYHRCVDFLQELPFIDIARLAITGHSRGGKATLLAGATDERIALVNNNASGAGGSATFRYVGDGGETIDIINAFPSWFGPGLSPFIGREQDIPFDQHCLLAAIAPRPLLSTYALDDRWSNPEGMVQCAWATREAYCFLGVADNLAFHLRPGGHSHTESDWEVLLDFMAWKTQNAQSEMSYNEHPYDHLRPAFSWNAPES